MTFTFPQDGSVVVEDGIRRATWPSMADVVSCQVSMGSADFSSQAARELMVVREEVRVRGGDPDSTTDLANRVRVR